MTKSGQSGQIKKNPKTLKKNHIKKKINKIKNKNKN